MTILSNINKISFSDPVGFSPDPDSVIEKKYFFQTYIRNDGSKSDSKMITLSFKNKNIFLVQLNFWDIRDPGVKNWSGSHPIKYPGSDRIRNTN